MTNDQLTIAYKEARETRLWLGMIEAAKLSEVAEVTELYAESDEIVRILFAILRRARTSRTALKH